MKFVEKRVKKEVRRQVSLHPGDVMAVAVSGGKDSMVTLHLLHSVFRERKDIGIQCITVDEGIAGYRPDSMRIVKKFCKERDIPYNGISFKHRFNITMDEAAPLSGDSSPCSYCGVFRRNAMNHGAKKIGAVCMATGHNLDDIVQSIMMNFTRGDVERMARLGPHKKVIPGMIPRIHPLRMIPEKESLLYAMAAGIPYHDGICPYSAGALRNRYRSLVDELEAHSPGTRHSIMSSYDRLLPLLIDSFGPADLKECACGEPASGERCKSCELIAALSKIKGP